MVNLVIVIISIALTAAILAASLQYIPMDAMQRNQMAVELTASVSEYQAGVGRYLVAQRERIPPQVAGELSPGYIIPWVGAGVDLYAQITPKYLFEPKGMPNTSWQVQTALYGGLEAVAICLQPAPGKQLTPNEQATMARVQAKFRGGSLYLNSTCNATSNVEGGTYLTLWVPISHYE